jgi:hypothetical protein
MSALPELIRQIRAQEETEAAVSKEAEETEEAAKEAIKAAIIVGEITDARRIAAIEKLLAGTLDLVNSATWAGRNSGLANTERIEGLEALLARVRKVKPEQPAEA